MMTCYPKGFGVRFSAPTAPRSSTHLKHIKSTTWPNTPGPAAIQATTLLAVFCQPSCLNHTSHSHSTNTTGGLRHASRHHLVGVSLAAIRGQWDPHPLLNRLYRGLAAQ